jgi:hypothetical protein
MAVKTSAAIKAELESADRDDIGRDMVDSLMSINRLKMLSFTGRSGAGACTLTGAAVGDVVQALTGISTVGSAAASFESIITVNNQIQQTSASNLSAITYMALLTPTL